MHEDYMLNNAFSVGEVEGNNKNLDSLFDNLTEDIANVNKYISEVNKKNKTNEAAQRELYDERQKLEKSKLNFENYYRAQEQELKKLRMQTEEYIALQTDKMRKAEEEFRSGMTSSLSELELEKKALEIEKENLKQEKAQFESYKSLEVSRINQAKEQIQSEKEQFAKYKDISMKKIELDNKNLEKKCLKFKEIMSQFNSNFKPIIDIEE